MKNPETTRGAMEMQHAGLETNTEGRAPEGRAPAVLQVVPRLEGGGVERATIDIAIALKEAGWSAVVASAGGTMAHTLDRHDIPHETLRLDSKNPFVMRANIGRLRRLIRAYGIDIVHARSRAPAWSAEIAARRAGAHFVTTFHGTYDAKSALKRRYNAVMTHGEKVIVISDFIAQHVRDTYGVDPARLRKIYRGVDTSTFSPQQVTQERMVQLAAEWNLPDDRQVILMPGRFSRWKGHELLVEALARLGRRDVLCVMVGADTASSDYLSAIEKRAKDRQVLEMLRFVDFTRDLAAAFMLSDVVVSASTRPEAFGRTLAEGMAMGRPVVGPKHGGAVEIVTEGHTGWLFTPGNSESLARALHTALSLNAGARHRLADEAIGRIQSEFANEQMCAKTLEVYSEIVFGRETGEGTAA